MMIKNLYDVTCYDNNKNILLSGTIEAYHRQGAARDIYKQVEKIYGKGIECEVVTILRKRGNLDGKE